MKFVPQEQIETRVLALPKIWADGEHDDIPGLIAAVKNEMLEFDGEIILPGEQVAIHGRRIGMSNGLWIVGPGAEPPNDPGEWVVVVQALPPRYIRITDCVFVMLGFAGVYRAA